MYTSAENNCEKHSAVHFFRRTRTAVFCVCSSAVVTAEPLKILATKTVEKNLVKSPQENLLLPKFFGRTKQKTCESYKVPTISYF